METQEESQVPAPRQSLSEIAKHPTIYLMVVAVGMAGYMMRSFQSASGDRTDDCKERLHACELNTSAKDREYKELTTKLLIKQGTIDAVQAMADSARSTTNP